MACFTRNVSVCHASSDGVQAQTNEGERSRTRMCTTVAPTSTRNDGEPNAANGYWETSISTRIKPYGNKHLLFYGWMLSSAVSMYDRTPYGIVCAF